MIPESSAEILRARARALARKPEAADRAPRLEVLEFRLAQESYAIETRHIVEVCPFRELTPLPGTPAFLRGIVNVRSRVVPVYDLKKFFDLPEQGITDLHRIILVRGADLELGILADMTLGVQALDPGRLQPSLPTLTGVRAEYLRGVTPERLIVLDLPRMLADPKILIDDSA